MTRHERRHVAAQRGTRPPTSEEAAGDWLKLKDSLDRALEEGLIPEYRYLDEVGRLEKFTGYDRPLPRLSRKPLGTPKIRLGSRLRWIHPHRERIRVITAVSQIMKGTMR